MTSVRTLPVAVEDTFLVAVEGVGHNVSRAKKPQYIGQRDGSPAYVDHQAAFGLVGGGPGQPHRVVGVPMGHGVHVHPDLNAHAEPGIVGDGVGRLVNVDHSHVVQRAAKDPVGGQAHGPDVQERQQASAMGREDVVPHRPIIEEPGAARVHSRGCSRGEAFFIGMDGGAVAAVIKVAVQVYQPGA